MTPSRECNCLPLPDGENDCCPVHGLDATDDAMMLIRLASDDRGRVDLAAMERRQFGSASRAAAALCTSKGWIDREGWITPAGYDALEQWSGE